MFRNAIHKWYLKKSKKIHTDSKYYEKVSKQRMRKRRRQRKRQQAGVVVLPTLPLFALFCLLWQVALPPFCSMHNFNLDAIAAAIGLCCGLRGSAHLARLLPFLAVTPFMKRHTCLHFMKANTAATTTEQQHVQQQQQCKQSQSEWKEEVKNVATWRCVVRVANSVTCCLCCCCLCCCWGSCLIWRCTIAKLGNSLPHIVCATLSAPFCTLFSHFSSQHVLKKAFVNFHFDCLLSCRKCVCLSECVCM